ncbi:TonB-dependent receptor [Dysgonomonas massiliensis]|uniref:TonB-dependent receptor n=1 Tax=Dysgonomonas massiliensis TaxID=2040292 RepID=UPI000C78CF6E|nr:TonB-dependent receptor [Dysgonomonas massiliensis]
MNKYILLLLLLLGVTIHAVANNTPVQVTDANLFGHVIDAKTKEHLPYVTVVIEGTTIGTTTDATGHYTLKDLPTRKLIVEARFVGYETMSIEVIIEKNKTQEINFELKKSSVSLDEIVVSANRNETSRKLAPTLVSILDAKTFDKTHSCSVGDGLNFQPGLRVENNCQNCGFTQVRMNGLEGAYSQILIDSRPVFSSLAGVYGLEQIPANMVERIEVVRGGGSALFGASAIAGTINIITKEPLRNSGQLSHSITSIGGESSFDNNTSFNVSLVSDDHKMGIMAYGQKRHRTAYDHDDDGFSEIPKLDNRTWGIRSYLKASHYSKFTLEYHNMQEFRRGGDRLNLQPFEAQIAEQAESKIDGGNIKYDWLSPDGKHRVSVYTASQLTNRNSYYGGGVPISQLPSDSIKAKESRLKSYGKTKDITFNAGALYSYDIDKLLFMPSTLTTGLEYNFNKLDDISGYRSAPVKQAISIYSVYAQNEWKNDMWGFLIGARMDKHRLLDSPILSPRANIRYNPTENINIRLSYGQGFRAPQLFDENLHVKIAQGEAITQILDPNLKEEKSHSFSGSVDYYLFLGRNQLNFLIEGFYTKLNDPFTTVKESHPDDKGREIERVVNASGAKVYGITLEARAATTANIEFQVGATIQRSLYDKARKWSGEDIDDDVIATRNMMRTPDFYGYFVATWSPVKQFNTSLSGTYTGSMYVPHEAGVIDRNITEKSPSFFDMNWKVAYNIPIYKIVNLELNAGVQNIFNAYQKDFDQGPDRASSYIYGPSLPRSFFVGAKISI